MNKPTYIGRISNKGSQAVSAPVPQSGGKSPKIKEGGDLRTGSKK